MSSTKAAPYADLRSRVLQPLEDPPERSPVLDGDDGQAHHDHDEPEDPEQGEGADRLVDLAPEKKSERGSSLRSRQWTRRR
jgi:hypothetical protein